MPSYSAAPSLTRRRWVITTAFGLGGITVSSWGPRLPAIKAELDVGTATIGLLLAGVTIGALGGQFASAALLRRLGGRRAMSCTLATVGAGLAALGLSLALRSVPLAAAAFVLIGAGVGLLDVLSNVEGSAVERIVGRTILPGMHAAWSIGAAVGSLAGAACAAVGVTPAAQLAGEGAVVALAVCWVAPGLPAHGSDLAAAPARQDRGSRLRQWLYGWLNWRLLLIGLVMFGVEFGEGSANSWLTLAVHNGHGQSAAVSALFFTVFAACEGLTRIFASPVVDRLGRVRAIRLTTGLGMLGMACFIVAGSAWVVLAGVALWAVGVSLGFPLGISAAAQSGPDPAARISLVTSIGYVASLAGPPVVGLLAEPAGLLTALWLVVALFAASFACAGALGRRQEATGPAGGPGPGRPG